LLNIILAIISNTHPDTGELIPRAFRMSYFVPCNIPIAIGLAISAPTVPFHFFCPKDRHSILSYGRLLTSHIILESILLMPMQVMQQTKKLK